MRDNEFASFVDKSMSVKRFRMMKLSEKPTPLISYREARNKKTQNISSFLSYAMRPTLKMIPF